MTPPVDKVAVDIFGLSIMWYGILIALGFFVGVLFARRNARIEKMDEDLVTDLVLWVIPFSIIGARLYYVIFRWDVYGKNPGAILNIREGGLAIYGGILAGLIVAYFYCKKKEVSFLKMADIYAPGIAIGQAIGRWGNFINQEAYGSPTDLPWAVLIEGKTYHPTFLYESIGTTLLSLFLMYYIRKKKSADGEVIALYGIGYGVIRFFIEGLRMDSLYLGNFRVSQLVSILFVVLGSGLLYKLRKKKVKNDRTR